jgi:hypothetical protein
MQFAVSGDANVASSFIKAALWRRSRSADAVRYLISVRLARRLRRQLCYSVGKLQ